MYDSDERNAPRNKLKPGDIVELQRKELKREVSNMCDDNIVPGQKEFDPKDYGQLHFFLDHYLKKTRPIGKLLGYGSPEDIHPWKMNVAVEFEHLGEVFWHYYHERDLRRVPNVSVEKRYGNKAKAKTLRKSAQQASKRKRTK